MWRDVYFFEIIDQTIKKRGLKRILIRTAVTTLFLGNMAGAVGSLTTLGHSAKKRFKAILNLDKLAEMCLFTWNLLRLTVIPSKYVPREVHIAGMIHCMFFLMQTQAFTRLSWDEGVAPVPKPANPKQGKNNNPYYQHRDQDNSPPMMYASNNFSSSNQKPYQSYNESY
jgi:hypothetical protein